MLSSTFDAVRAILKADPSVGAHERTAILCTLRGKPPKPITTPSEPAGARVLSPKRAGELLGRSPRGMHLLAQQGVLEKVYLPGRRRAAGFRLSDVEALITAKVAG